MKPIGWKPKLSYQDSTTKLAIWKCNIPKNEGQPKQCQASTTSVPKLWVKQLERRDNKTLH
jgi:hypothetical protein